MNTSNFLTRTLGPGVFTLVALLCGAMLAELGAAEAARAPAGPPPDNKAEQLSRQVDALSKALNEEREFRAAIQAQLAQLKQTVNVANAALSAAKTAQEEQAKEIAALKRQLEQLAEKANSQPAAGVKSLSPAEARQELTGTWQVVSVDQGGGQPAENDVREVVFAGKTLTFKSNGKPERSFEYKLDPGEEPREITLLSGGRSPVLGIYAITTKGAGAQSETVLELCVDQGKALRPAEFKTNTGGHTALWRLKRATGSATKVSQQ